MRRLSQTILAVLLIVAFGTVSLRPAEAAIQPEGLIKMISLPNVPPPAGAAASFDIGWVDGASQRYYIADRVNFGVSIIDASNGTYLGTVAGFTGPQPTGFGGPNGVTVAPDLNQVWAGDGNSTVKVIDIPTRTIIGNISTGGTARADELAYDPDHHMVLVGNDRKTTPFLSLISTQTMSVVQKIPMPGASGIEQPVYDPAQKVFLQAIPSSTANPGGEVDVVDPVSKSITKTFSLTACNPNGATLGPNEQLLLGCGHGGTGSQINTQIINATNGSLIKNFTQTGGADEVWYNPGDNRYYLGSTGWTTTGLIGGPPSPVLGIIDAATNTFVQNVPITTSRSGSVAVNPVNNWAFVPIVQPANFPPLATSAGIGVFAVMGGQNLKLTSMGSAGIRFDWQGIHDQPSYTLARISAAGQTDISIPGGATQSYIDTTLPSGTGACYQLFARDLKGAISGRSLMYCALPGSGSASGPRNVSIQLTNDSTGAARTATLTWTAPSSGTVANYLVLPVGTTRIQVLGSGTTTATDATGGAATCYMVDAVSSSGTSSLGDIVCAIPNTDGF